MTGHCVKMERHLDDKRTNSSGRSPDREICILAPFGLLATLMALAVSIMGLLEPTSAETSAKPPVPLLGEEISNLIYADTRVWIRNSEFSDSTNWRRRRKPCNLREKINFKEQAVVSLGASLDSPATRKDGSSSTGMEANIRDLALANDGVLLLEEDTWDEKLDLDYQPVAFIKHILHHSDCRKNENEEADYEFRMPGYRMSWFNPSNWESSLIEIDIEHLVPDSHQIPCAYDMVQFGIEDQSWWNFWDEESLLSSFKVTFEPSQWVSSRNLTLDELRVSRLKIGNMSLSQRQLELLVGLDSPYHNLLFQFDSPNSVLRSSASLLIEDSSVSSDNSSASVCLDEAGCLCNNESPQLMSLVCSFTEPLNGGDLACHDPIESAGYCNKICATVLSIRMDPAKFSERYLHSLLMKMLDDSPVSELFGNNVFIAARRVSYTKFEITFRLIADVDYSWSANFSRQNYEWLLAKNFETNLGKERQFAQLVYEKLNNGKILVVSMEMVNFNSLATH